jgi:hypothetical protein
MAHSERLDESVTPGFHIWTLHHGLYSKETKRYVHLEPLKWDRGHPGYFGGEHRCDSCPYTHNVVGCYFDSHFRVTEYTQAQFFALANNKLSLTDREQFALSVLNS